MDKTQKFWDKQAKKYDHGERQFEHTYRKIIDKTKAHLNNTDIALDIGCATGTKTLELAVAVKKIYGIDLSSGMINEARRKKLESGISNIQFIRGTVFDNSFESETFDVIVSYGVLHLLKNIEDTIQRIRDLLKPGGLFISTTACLKDGMALKNKMAFSATMLVKRMGLFPLFLNMMRMSDMEHLIGNADFQLVEAERMFHGITFSYIVAKKI